MLALSLVIVTAAFLAGRFGFAYMYLVVCLMIMAGAVKRQLEKTQLEQRHEIHREQVLRRGPGVGEKAEWFNVFFNRLWTVYRSHLAHHVADMMEPYLDFYKPPQIKSITIERLQLGKASPTFPMLLAYKQSEPNQIRLDVEVMWSDDEASIVVNSKVGALSTEIEINRLSVQATLRIDVMLQEAFPFVTVLRVSLTEPPKFDFGVKTMKTLDVMVCAMCQDVPWLSDYIRNTISQLVTAYVVDPEFIELNVAAMYDPLQVYSSDDLCQGVLLVHVYSAENLPKKDAFGSCDPYVRVGMGDNLYRTRVVKDTLHPIFNTTFRMLVHNTANEKLHLYLLDNNKMGAHDLISDIVQDLDVVVPPTGATSASELKEIEVPLRPRGTLKLGLQYFPVPPYQVPEALDLAQVPSEGAVAIPDPQEAIELWETGILRIHIHAAKGLRSPTNAKLIQSHVIAYEGLETSDRKRKVYRTSTQAGSDPVYNKVCEVLIANPSRSLAKVTLKVKNNVGFLEENIGECILDIGTILAYTNDVRKEWFKFSSWHGELLLSLHFTNMDLGADLGGEDPSEMLARMEKAMLMSGKTWDRDNLGSLNVTIHEARRLVAADSRGTSDPYVTLRIKDVTFGKTTVKLRTLSPTWQESFSVPLPDVRDLKLQLQVMDFDQMSADDFIGEAWVDLHKELTADVLGRQQFSGWKKLKKVKTGELLVTVNWVPPGHGGSNVRVLSMSKSMIGSDGSLANPSSNESGPPMSRSSSIVSNASRASNRSSLASVTSATNLGAEGVTRTGTFFEETPEDLQHVGSWGSMRMTVEQIDNLPPANFNPAIHITCNERLKTRSKVYRPGRLVVCNFTKTIPLDQPPKDTNFRFKITNQSVAQVAQRVLARNQQRFKTTGNIALATVFGDQLKPTRNGVEFTARLYPNELANQMYPEPPPLPYAEAKVRIAVFANSPSAFETAAKEMRQSSAEPLQNPSSPAPAPAQPGAT